MQGDEACVREKSTAFNNRIRRLISLSGRGADLPVTDSFLLEMADDGVLQLKGCRGILVCTDRTITARTDRSLLTVTGEGLYFKHYSGTDASVGGRIDSIVFGG